MSQFRPFFMRINLPCDYSKSSRINPLPKRPSPKQDHSKPYEHLVATAFEMSDYCENSRRGRSSRSRNDNYSDRGNRSPRYSSDEDHGSRRYENEDEDCGVRSPRNHSGGPIENPNRNSGYFAHISPPVWRDENYADQLGQYRDHAPAEAARRDDERPPKHESPPRHSPSPARQSPPAREIPPIHRSPSPVRYSPPLRPSPARSQTASGSGHATDNPYEHLSELSDESSDDDYSHEMYHCENCKKEFKDEIKRNQHEDLVHGFGWEECEYGWCTFMRNPDSADWIRHKAKHARAEEREENRIRRLRGR